MANLINNLLFSDLKEELGEKDSMLILTLNRLDSEEAHNIRGRFHEAGISMRVVKNRIAAKALDAIGAKELGGFVMGQCAIAYGPEEGVVIKAAKILEEEMKGRKAEKRTLNVRAAILDGEVIPPEAAVTLHTLPDKDTVRSMLLSVIQGPMRGLATVIDAPVTSVARVINAHCEEEDS